jgi:hypothetical protein
MNRDLQEYNESLKYEFKFNARREWEAAVRSRQDRVTVREVISWIRNSKEEFDRLVKALY